MGFARLFEFWKSRSSISRRVGAHVTFLKNRGGNTITRTGMFLRRRIWLFPIIAVTLLTIIGWGVRHAIESTMRESLRNELETLLHIETQMLDTWMKVQTSNAETQANAMSTRELIDKLMSESTQETKSEQDLKSSVTHHELNKVLAPMMNAHDYSGYVVIDKSNRILSATDDALIGRQILPDYEKFIQKAFQGRANVCPPFGSSILVKDEFGVARTGVPTMFVCAPVRDSSFQIIGVLALRIRPEKEFTKILQLGQLGESGETYALDQSGVMVSNSRFDEELILTGLLPDHDHSRSILNVQIRDPGGNLTEGYRAKVRRSQQPLTYAAKQAIEGNSGVNLDGYRDYRGVLCLGAYGWNATYEMGLITEINYDEAYRPLMILNRTFWGLFALLGLSSLAIFIFTIVVSRMQREAQKQAIANQKLGQYRLEEKLGAGGMGVVYKGYHALLRRPTAIKMLDVDKVNEGSVERFEREVQITCQLNHPNTVAIYDFGRTDEGVFYYAMEYLDGIDLQVLIDRFGPQPEGRVIQILRQICGSLFEAHSLGLVHRDIKPANIMLNRRGGESDVAKVLDFGLVKALDESKGAAMTAANSLTGTPLYMSPEAIQTPHVIDGRSDLYAVGAVGYFLLTGHPVFEAKNIVELCQMHVSTVPDTPSKRLGRPISQELESALLACLEKSSAKRPQTARDLAQLLAQCPMASSWSIDTADAWWGRYERGDLPNPQAESHVSSTGKGSVFDRTIVRNYDEES